MIKTNLKKNEVFIYQCEIDCKKVNKIAFPKVSLLIVVSFLLFSCINNSKNENLNKQINDKAIDNAIDNAVDNLISTNSDITQIDEIDSKKTTRKVYDSVVKEEYGDGSFSTIVKLADNKSKKIVYENLADDQDAKDILTIDLSDKNSINSKDLQFAKFIDNDLELYKGKIFVLKGELLNGQIRIVSDSEEIVHIVLDGVNIRCNKEFAICSPFDNKILFTLNENTENIITFEKETDKKNKKKKNSKSKALSHMEAGILAKNTIFFDGSGTLNINGEIKKAIWTGDRIYFNSGYYKIYDTNEAINGNTGIIIKSGTFDINVSDDAFVSEDIDNGFVFVEGGNVDIVSLKKGIKASNEFIIIDGNMNIESIDESIIAKSIDIIDGNIDIVSKNDCLSAIDVKNNISEKQDNVYIRLYGGKLNLDSWIDGIDSKGDLYFEGTDIYLSGPTRHAEKIFNYRGNVVCDKGDIIALGASKEVKDFGDNSSQNFIIVYFNDARPKGWAFMLKDDADNVIMSFIPNKKYRVALITSDKLNIGNSYNVVSWEDTIKIDINDKKTVVDLRKK